MNSCDLFGPEYHHTHLRKMTSEALAMAQEELMHHRPDFVRLLHCLEMGREHARAWATLTANEAPNENRY